MKFIKNIIYPKQPNYFMFLFGIFLSINTLKALGSEGKFYSKKNHKNYDFEQIYFQNSISYSEYDEVEGQLKSFFGLNSDLSKNNYYPDLNIIYSSEAVREIYRSKLNDMIEEEFIYKLEK